MTFADDQLEIRNVLARVAHLTDGRGTLQEYLGLWTEDCLWESPVAGTWRGHEGHLARHEKFRAAGVQGPDAQSYHVLTTTWVGLRGDEADALSTWMLISRWSGSPAIEDVGTYTDVLRRTPNGWKLATRHVAQGSGEWLRAKEAAAGQPPSA
jgi:ketosteroid isomerase-like protein